MKAQETMGNLHDRARNLIDRNLIEGLEPEELRWLADHLAQCQSCATRSAFTEVALQALRTSSVPLPRGLAASTKLRVREEAANLKQRRARNLALILGCTVSWIAGVASAPLVWRVFEWLGATLDLPRIVWELGFISWWFVPAAAVGLMILWITGRSELESMPGPVEMGTRSNKL